MSTVIVGGGVAGTTAFIALVRAGAATEIDIVDPRPPGTSTAFGVTDPALLCNTSADLMSVVPGVPGDFRDHLGVHPEAFVPRMLFGRYVRDRYLDHCRVAERAGIRHRRIGRRAVGVECAAGGYRVRLDDGTSLDAAHVIVGLGWGAPAVPAVAAGRLSRELIFASPFPERAMLDALPPGARVLVLGTRLSAIDATLLLCGRGHRVLMTSPSGELPAVRTRTVRSPATLVEAADLAALDPADPYLDRRMLSIVARATGRRLCEQADTSADPLVRLRAEIRLAEQGRTLWQDVLVDLIDAANAVLVRRTPAERRAALGTCERLLSRYLGAFPLANAQLLDGHLTAGRARLRAGAPVRLDGGPPWRVTWPGGDAEEFDAVVCATGFVPSRLPVPVPPGVELIGMSSAARVPLVNAVHHLVDQAGAISLRLKARRRRPTVAAGVAKPSSP